MFVERMTVFETFLHTSPSIVAHAPGSCELNKTNNVQLNKKEHLL